MVRLCITALLCLLFAACRPETYTPKPRGYFRIDLPEHVYQEFSKPEYPYSFQYPVYGKIVKDTNFFGEKPENPYWIYIDFPSVGGTVYVSYKQISAAQPLHQLMQDAHKMSFYHDKKANSITEHSFNNPNGVNGIMYEVGGNAASAYQFVATDSVRHFIRGALYFNVTPNADSLKPVNDFLRKDIEYMLYTLKWKS